MLCFHRVMQLLSLILQTSSPHLLTLLLFLLFFPPPSSYLLVTTTAETPGTSRPAKKRSYCIPRPSWINCELKITRQAITPTHLSRPLISRPASHYKQHQADPSPKAKRTLHQRLRHFEHTFIHHSTFIYISFS